MAIADAACLGSALKNHPEDLHAALQQYDKARVPQTTREVCTVSLLGMYWLRHAASLYLMSGQNKVCGACALHVNEMTVQSSVYQADRSPTGGQIAPAPSGVFLALAGLLAHEWDEWAEHEGPCRCCFLGGLGRSSRVGSTMATTMHGKTELMHIRLSNSCPSSACMTSKQKTSNLSMFRRSSRDKS